MDKYFSVLKSVLHAVGELLFLRFYLRRRLDNIELRLEKLEQEHQKTRSVIAFLLRGTAIISSED